MLPMLVLAAQLSLSLPFFNLVIVSLMLAILLTPLFNSYNHLWDVRPLSIVTNFLVLWSICLSFFSVHFKNGPEHLRKVSLWWNFCGRDYSWEVFSSLNDTLFLCFLSSMLVRWYPLPIFPNTCTFSSLQELWFFPGLAVLFFPFFVFSHSSLSVWHILKCQIPFLYSGYVFLLFVSESPISFFVKILDVVYVHKVLTLF